MTFVHGTAQVREVALVCNRMVVQHGALQNTHMLCCDAIQPGSIISIVLGMQAEAALYSRLAVRMSTTFPTWYAAFNEAQT